MDQAEALFFANPYWSWIAIGAMFLIGELMTGSGWLLWPAGAAAVGAVITYLTRLSWPLQIVLFVVVAVVATYVGRRFLRPVPKDKGDINDQTRRLIGKQGEVAAPFQSGQGRVFVDGAEWIAELEPGQTPPEPGARVEVVAVHGGGRLVVRGA